jgi:hypothetical protein
MSKQLEIMADKISNSPGIYEKGMDLYSIKKESIETFALKHKEREGKGKILKYTTPAIKESFTTNREQLIKINQMGRQQKALLNSNVAIKTKSILKGVKGTPAQQPYFDTGMDIDF